MTRDWATEQYDLYAAEAIIKKHVVLNNGQSLGIFEVEVCDKEDMTVRVSDWILELAEHFYQLYGREHGDFVTKMVISKFITKGHTIH